jgi:stage 0 sporulation protein B (sporulation initiation phosphotransferase)
MDKQWTTIEILRHSRHDWLNKIQLIKGNLDLNKVDRVKRIIDEIVIEAQHESRIASLNMPGLIELLLTANWGTNPFRFEFEVISLERGAKSLDSEMTHWIVKLFSVLKEAMDWHGENVLTLAILENKEQILCFSFELQGTIKNEKSLEQFLLQTKDEWIRASISELNDQEAVFQVEVNSD